MTHEYEDNTCVLCGWRVSGLYVDGKLELTWQQLKDGGYVEVENHALINCSDNLMGTLVVDEEISSIPGYQDWRDWYRDKGTFEGMSSIEYIWLPRTVTAYAIENAPSFAGCSKLREVITFGEMTEMGSGDVFANCSSLERIDIPYGTSVIGAFCFFNCANLKEISIPETVQSIEDAAFVQSGITEITLPEGVQRVDLDAFCDTAVKRITLPSSVTTLSGGDSTDFKYYDFHDGIDRRYVPNQNLEYIDASACNIDELYSIEFYNFNAIKTILLPNSLKKIDNYSLLGYKPIVLILLEGFKEVLLRPSSGDPIENIHSIVWPTSFTTVPKYGMSFNTIYFRGSEMQWKLIENIDKISYKNIVFNYEGDGSELMD